MNNELYHSGVRGMRWYHRRWQNEDGTYTEAGKERYFGKKSKSDDSNNTGNQEKKQQKAEARAKKREEKAHKRAVKAYDKQYEKNFIKAYNNAARWVNQRIGTFNDEWSKEFAGYTNWADSPKYQSYINSYNEWFDSAFKQSMKDLIGERPT